MSSQAEKTRLDKWTGYALVFGGLLLAVHYITHPPGETWQYVSSPIWVPSHVLGYVAGMVILPGLIGFYALHREKLGRAGLVGVGLVFVGGTTAFNGILWGGALIQPYLLANNAPALNDALVTSTLGFVLILMLVTFMVGYLAIEIAVFRTKVLPGWVAWLIVLSLVWIPLAVGLGLAFGIGFVDLSLILLSLSFSGWGYALLSKPQAPAG